MKRLIAVLILLLSLPIAVQADVDLSAMSFDELVALKDQINLAIWNCQEWQEVLVPQGLWQVGVDIPAGHWTIKAADGAFSSVRYGDTLDESNDISYHSSGYIYEYIYSPTCSIFDENSDKSQIDIDMKDGCYVQISSGSCVFSPYSGKPSLGFSNGSGFVKVDSTPAPTSVPVDPDGYAAFDFVKASRYPDEYAGTKTIIEGSVMQVMGSPDEGYDIRLSTKGTYDDVVYIVVRNSAIPDVRILDDDQIRVKAVMDGEYTYESVMGAKITLPIAYAHSVEILTDY